MGKYHTRGAGESKRSKQDTRMVRGPGVPPPLLHGNVLFRLEIRKKNSCAATVTTDVDAHGHEGVVRAAISARQLAARQQQRSRRGRWRVPYSGAWRCDNLALRRGCQQLCGDTTFGALYRAGRWVALCASGGPRHRRQACVGLRSYLRKSRATTSQQPLAYVFGEARGRVVFGSRFVTEQSRFVT